MPDLFEDTLGQDYRFTFGPKLAATAGTNIAAIVAPSTHALAIMDLAAQSPSQVQYQVNVIAKGSCTAALGSNARVTARFNFPRAGSAAYGGYAYYGRNAANSGISATGAITMTQHYQAALTTEHLAQKDLVIGPNMAVIVRALPVPATANVIVNALVRVLPASAYGG